MFHIGVPVCAHLRPPLLDFRSGFLNSVVRFSAFHVVTHDARCFKVCWLVIASQTLWLTMINLQESPSLERASIEAAICASKSISFKFLHLAAVPAFCAPCVLISGGQSMANFRTSQSSEVLQKQALSRLGSYSSKVEKFEISSRFNA